MPPTVAMSDDFLEAYARIPRARQIVNKCFRHVLLQ